MKRIVFCFMALILLMTSVYPVYAQTPEPSEVSALTDVPETLETEAESLPEETVETEAETLPEETQVPVMESEDLSEGNFGDAETSASKASGETPEVLSEHREMNLNHCGGLAPVDYTEHGVQTYASTTEDMLRQRLNKSLENCITEIDIEDLGILYTQETSDWILDILVDLINSNYRYFFVGTRCTIYYYNGGNCVSIELQFDPAYMKNGQPDRKKIDLERARMDSAVSEALACIKPGMSKLEMVLAAHDYIVSVCDYNYADYLSGTLTIPDYSLYGVLIEGSAVCQGYAQAFGILMQEVGIDCYMVTSDYLDHAWNLVYLDGSWYHLDATWDDPVFGNQTYYQLRNNDYADEGFVDHTYFLKSDEEFRNLKHTAWDSGVPAANASGTYDSYCFNHVASNMIYHQGYWYFINSANRNQLLKTKIDSSSKSVMNLKYAADYVHMLNGVIYYSSSQSNVIASVDLSLQRDQIYADIHSEYPGFKIHEFGVKHGQMVAVLYNGGSGKFKRVTDIAPSQRQLTELLILSKPKKLEYRQGEDLDLRGLELVLVYSDTSTVPLTEGYTVSGFNTNKGGKQRITITYGKLKATFEIYLEKYTPVEAFVARLYEEILGRDPDPAGLKAWSQVLVSGKEQGAKVAQGFVDSDELRKRNLSDDAYIKALYRTFFDREADSAGLKAWKRVLDSGLSRMHVFRGFAESAEFSKICRQYGIERGNADLTAPMDQNEGVTKFIVRCYRLCLGREADKDGLNSWCTQILTGQNTAKQAARGFVFSREFIKKDLSDAEYIKVLYRVFLDREADAGGLAAWTAVLKRGESREHVFNGFADSDEFRKLCASYGIAV